MIQDQKTTYTFKFPLRSGCKKCTDHNHREHASKAELEWDEIAWRYLKQFRGLFDSK